MTRLDKAMVAFVLTAILVAVLLIAFRPDLLRPVEPQVEVR